MSGWNPQLLTTCVGSDFLGWLTGLLALGMLIWYLVIAKLWYNSMKSASKGGRVVWGWLIIIFVVCAMAGYVSWILALFVPKLATALRIIFLTAQNVACPVFWSAARKYEFSLIGAYQRTGETIIKRAKEIESMSDREIASLVRTLVSEFLARKVVSPSA